MLSKFLILQFVKTLRDDGGYDKTGGGSITFATDVSSMELLHSFNEICDL